MLLFLKDMVTQALELSKKPHIVVATPGRLADHIRSSDTFDMKKLRFLVRKQLLHTHIFIQTLILHCLLKQSVNVDININNLNLAFSLDPGRGGSFAGAGLHRLH